MTYRMVDIIVLFKGSLGSCQDDQINGKDGHYLVGSPVSLLCEVWTDGPRIGLRDSQEKK